MFSFSKQEKKRQCKSTKSGRHDALHLKRLCFVNRTKPCQMHSVIGDVPGGIMLSVSTIPVRSSAVQDSSSALFDETGHSCPPKALGGPERLHLPKSLLDN